MAKVSKGWLWLLCRAQGVSRVETGNETTVKSRGDRGGQARHRDRAGHEWPDARCVLGRHVSLNMLARQCPRIKQGQQ